jgi:hypothetical protein
MMKAGAFLATLAALAALGLAGCAAPSKPSQPGSTGQLLALTQCPLRVAEARAWLTHLAGQRETVEDLHVSARLLNDATALILRSDASTADTLILEMRISEDSTTPGRIVYRERAPTPLYSRVVFRCHGGDVHVISDIEKRD